MTRINCVPVKELHDKHLMAEYYELPRVFGLVRAELAKGRDPAKILAPEKYTLGTGHLKFFYTRLGWLIDRQTDIIIEMIERKKKPNLTDMVKLGEGIPPALFGQWTPTEEALAINRARLAQRLAEMATRPKQKLASHRE